MKTYLIVNPFNNNASHGIHNYIINIIYELESLGLAYDYIYNKGLSIEDFREYVYNYVHTNYGYDEVIIEAPETRAPTLYLENKYNVHIRLHTPSAIAQKYDGKQINQQAYSNELRVINKAKIISSPSYGLIDELESELNLNRAFVYKNPYNKHINISSKKEYDLIFLGRFQPLKGIEYINPILEKLPEDFKVILVGKDSHLLKISKHVKCNVEVYDHISDSSRFELISKSKTLMLLSKFENCSMVILEALACKTIVNAWDVGGNSEIANEDVLKIIPFEDIIAMSDQIINNSILPYPSDDLFSKALNNISIDFHNGLIAIIEFLNGKRNDIYRGQNFSSHHNNIISKRSVKFSKEDFGERIFGFSISNEHIEEMWMPIINKFGSEYLFVSKRPKGYHHCFSHSYYVDDSRYLVYDWINNPKRLLEDIKRFKPNKIFFHNGSHPSYQKTLNFIKENCDIPIVYSELGWFPQNNNIYFDEYGTNGKSKIASQDFYTFTGRMIPKTKDFTLQRDKSILIVTQSENDTNLIVNSSRFKKNISFVEYVLEQLSLLNENKNIIIKTHPLDPEKTKMDQFISSDVDVIHDGDIGHLLSKSKAVIGINSTVLLEALKYDCNIYMFGKSVLSNKSIAIDCSIKDLSDVWTDRLVSSREAKDILIEEFKSRQIDLTEIDKKPLSECLSSPAFKPLLSSIKVYDTKKLSLSILPQKAVSKTKIATPKKVDNIYKKSTLERKFCKLIFHTKSFILDSKSPVIVYLKKKLIKNI